MVVGDRDRDGVRIRSGAARVVIAVLVCGAETGYARGKVERGRGFARAPIDEHRVRVQRVGIAERAAERGDSVLIDGRGQIQRGDHGAEVSGQEVLTSRVPFAGAANAVGAGDERLVHDELVAAVARDNPGSYQKTVRVEQVDVRVQVVGEFAGAVGGSAGLQAQGVGRARDAGGVPVRFGARQN